jgi:hypothetical protein
MTNTKLKQTKEQKLKTKIKGLEKLLKQALDDVEWYKGREHEIRQSSEQRSKDFDRFFSRYEAREIPALEERTWLRELVELMVVDADKFEKLRELKVKNSNSSDPYAQR